jgi:hypothetical protein
VVNRRNGMSKYKICKFVNGNGKEWYQVKKKGWIFWSYLSSYEWFGHPEIPPIRIVIKFTSFDKAKKHIEMIKHINNNAVIKKVECIDYV